MLIRWILAALHLLALGIGLGAVWVRGSVLPNVRDLERRRVAFKADSLWGIAFLLWVSTGLLRAFGGFEKGTAYYVHSSTFMVKMLLLALILILEIWPMVALIRWRIQTGRNQDIDASRAPLFATISRVQALLVILMIFAATAMARGFSF
jgi:putative membrane protein